MSDIHNLLESFKIKKSSTVNTVLIIICILILVSGIIQLRYFLSKSRSDIHVDPTIIEIVPPIMNYTFHESSVLGDYHVLGSHKSCLKDNYVSLKQLYNIIYAGFRWIDLEIFTIRGKTVVSSSNDSTNFSRKMCKNTIQLSSCLEIIKNALRVSPNKDDPFFIQLRMKTSIKHSYDETAKQIKNQLQELLLPSLYSSNAKYLQYDIENEFMVKLKQKVVIIVRDYSNILESTYLYEYTNIHVQKDCMYRYSEINHASKEQQQQHIQRNKMTLSVVLPDDTTNKNFDVNKSVEIGVHGLLLNVAQQDNQYKNTIKMFSMDGSTRSFRMRKEENRNIPIEETICSNSKPGDNIPIKTTVNILGMKKKYSSG